MKCSVPGCDNEAVTKFDTCKNCYSSILKWRSRSRQDQTARLEKLHLYESRLDVLLPASQSSKKFNRVKEPWSFLPGDLFSKKFKRKKNAKTEASGKDG